MELTLLVILILISAANTALIFAVKNEKTEIDTNAIVNANQNNFNALKEEIRREFKLLTGFFDTMNKQNALLIENYNKSIKSEMSTITEMQKQQLKHVQDKMKELIVDMNSNMNKILENNEKKLEQMRVTVDEKLNESLEKRFKASFEVISNQLESFSKGIGEMKSLANGVGDLKKVLTNVKTRGTFGEVQLGQLLEQMLSNYQFSANVGVKEHSQERVDYAVNLPGKDDKTIFLPIDSKFPIEDYLKLVEVSENGSLEEVKKQATAIEKTIKKQAKSISEKYINVPVTTDFAIMYLPVEGLYSEVVRNTGLVEQLQRDYRIIVCGPTTLSAILNSLQMGFKTLAIEKRSSEIWSLLNIFKKEFTTFMELLSKTQKKINEASNTIDDATKRTRIITKKLDKVSDIEGIEDDGDDVIAITNIIK